MYHSLSKLLKGHNPALAAHIVKLEEVTGANSEDIRLDMEISQRVKRLCGALGLDSADTTNKELFHALQARFEADSMALAGTFEATAKAYEAIFASLKPVTVAVKPVVLKKVIKANPPKNLIKQLGYRSLDSMLKREKPGELLLAAGLVEPLTWHQKYKREIAKLKHTDFDVEPVTIMCSSDVRWQKVAQHLVAKQGNTVLYSWESAAIMLLVPPSVSGLELANVFAVHRALETCMGHGSLLRFVQVNQQFHRHFQELLNGRLKVFSLAGRDIGWRTVMALLAAMDEAALQDRFGLHVTPSDFTIPNLIQAFAKNHETLAFWEESFRYSVIEEEGKHQALSLNPGDLAQTLIPKKLSYEQADSREGIHALEEELLLRYALHPVIQEQILLQLEHL